MKSNKVAPITSAPSHPDAEMFAADEDYNPGEFYTRAVDSKGHKETFHTGFPPHVYSAIANLVAQRRIKEYRSPHDLIRDAVHHRLHWINQRLKDGELEQALRLERVQARLEQWQLEMAEAKRVIETFEAVLSEAEARGDQRRKQEVLDSAHEALDELESPDRKRLEAIIKRFEK